MYRSDSIWGVTFRIEADTCVVVDAPYADRMDDGIAVDIEEVCRAIIKGCYQCPRTWSLQNEHNLRDTSSEMLTS